MSDFVAPEDRRMLRKLVDDAMAGPPQRLPGVSMRLRHSTSSTDDSTYVTFKQPYLPVDVKVCYDGQFLYCVMLDATEDARLEENLRNYLMTTSHDLRTPIHSVQTASALLSDLLCVQSDGDAMPLLKSIEGCCTVLEKLINNVCVSSARGRRA